MVFIHLCAWIVSQVLLWSCALLLFCKRIQRQNPVFAAYVVAQSLLLLTSDMASIGLVHRLISLDFFQWIAFAGVGTLAALEITLLYELANGLLLSRASLSSTVRALMRSAAAVLLLTAAGTAALLGKPGLGRVMAAFQTLDFSSNVIAFGLLIVLLIFTRALQISWRTLPAGIALGLAITGCAEITGSALLSHATRAQHTEIDSFQLVGFCGCVVIWLVYMLLPDEQARYSGERLKLEELKNWDEQMQQIRR